jgi:serine/threonine protein kinase
MSSDFLFVPDGYHILRPLSERNGSWVYLARNELGAYCCLKIQILKHSDSLEALIENRKLLQSLSQNAAFVRLRNWGFDRIRLMLWEEMELADDSVSGRSFSPEQEPTYTPQTLAAHVRENGSVETVKIINWAIDICEAVVQLHALGLFHRDIKPANLLIVNGRCVLGDFGSVGKAGTSIEFPGTEGYVPPDGMGSPALDVFALARTIYEAWTGLDRFQFPSLPARVIDADDWKSHGWQLNRVLSQAADKRPSHRIPSAVRLLESLKQAGIEKRQISRRQVATGISAILAGGVGFYIWRSIPPYVAVWKRLPPERFGIEGWRGDELTVDWKNGLFYSGFSDARGTYLNVYDLKRWKKRDEQRFPNTFRYGCQLLIEDGTALLCMQYETGQCYRIDPTLSQIESIGIENLNEPTFASNCYMNAASGRIGCFGGYGHFQVSNGRYELNAQEKRWENISDEGDLPLPRYGCVSYSDRKKDILYLFGGEGNENGEQGKIFKGLKDFNGRFYPLRDLWTLDHKRNRWTCLFGVQKWGQQNVYSGIYHSGIEKPILLSGSAPGSVTEAQFHVWEGEVGKVPRTLPNQGERIPMFRCWSLLQEPESQDLWVFADEGVFSVTLKIG